MLNLTNINPNLDAINYILPFFLLTLLFFFLKVSSEFQIHGSRTLSTSYIAALYICKLKEGHHWCVAWHDLRPNAQKLHGEIWQYQPSHVVFFFFYA